jgi:ribosomal protein S7
MKFRHVDGKKSVAEGIVYGAFDTIETSAKQDPLGSSTTRSTT